MIALAPRAGLQAGKVGARAGFGIALAPPVGAIQDAGQPVLLLLLAAIFDEDGGQHRQAERHDARGVCHGDLGLEDEALDHAPPGAAPFLGPMVRQPALLVQDGVPFLHVLLGQALALPHLVGQAGGQLFLQKAAHFLAEGFVFGGKVQIHGLCPVMRGFRKVRPRPCRPRRTWKRRHGAHCAAALPAGPRRPDAIRSCRRGGRWRWPRH